MYSRISKYPLLLLVILVIVTTSIGVGNAEQQQQQQYHRLRSPYAHYYNSKDEYLSKRQQENLESSSSSSDSPPPYTEYYYTQTLDHFNFNNKGTFQQRYLLATEYWNKPSQGDSQCNGSVIFYTGNEGDIELFYLNSQFLTNVLAKEMNALLFFAEHRYFGKSLPFGNDSNLPGPNIGYCSSEQALADYAELIQSVLASLGASNCPVIAAGGSYGGMLASWMRMKYPNVVDGALAASAPILQFLGTGAQSEAFNEIATNDFTTTSGEGTCSERIRNAFKEIMQTSQEPTGLQQLTKQFTLCEPLTDVNTLINWIESGITYMAMADYPYEANFLEPMPGNPINVSCSLMNGIQDDIQALLQVIHVYYNWTGQAGQCYNTSIFTTSSLGSNVWDYLACTEMVMPISSNGVQDMFPVSQWTIESTNEYCQATWGVTPNPYWITTYYGGSQQVASSNIIFSNGILDPWRGGGVVETSGDSIIAITIDGGAHHLDLRLPNVNDPSSVIEARALETQLLLAWTSQASIDKKLK